MSVQWHSVLFCDKVRMKTLYLFNPENDMALAYGGPYYMPPANVRRMANHLSALPMWYALPQSEVWISDTRQIRWMENECPLHLPVKGVETPDIIYNKVYPWGWSASLVHRLQGQGVSSCALPDRQQLERIRSLSARGTAVNMLQRVNLPHTLGEAKVISSLDEICFPPPFLLKAPWSGSGRGIQKVEGNIDAPMRGWINHILKTQGYVVMEPYYQKVVDFAMEFCMERGDVRFMGYSLFETDVRGLYKENLLAANAEIERRLSAYVPVEILQDICGWLQKELPRTLEGYDGCLGVDMMVCALPEGRYAVHPCVEINLRMNMGIVARAVCDCYVVAGTIGRYVIEYYPQPGEALRMHQILQRQHPLVLEGQKIRQGYFSLTPVFDDTAYQAYVIIN